MAAYAECVAAKGCSSATRTVHWSQSTGDAALWSQFCNGADRPDHPINCVDWAQAAAYCRWADKRLPTEAEWEYAARGSDGRPYPWGSQPPTGKLLNACGVKCSTMMKRELQTEWMALYADDDGATATAAVGRYAEGASPFGALDMAGNVWEWTADWYGPYPDAKATDPQGPPAGAFRVYRGGGWLVYGADWVRATFRAAGPPFWAVPSLRHSGLGFRCARRD